MTQLIFAHVGMDHVICANRVLAIIAPQTKCGQRYSKTAKENGRYIDATVGRTIKSLLLLDDGSVMVSAIKPKTLLKRFMSYSDDEENICSEDS